MALMPQLWTISGLETEIGVDRRTLGQALASVPPEGKVGGRDAWLIRTALATLKGPDGSLDPPQEKARLDKLRADKTEVELEKLKAELIPASQIDKALDGVQQQVRRWLMAAPAVAAPQVLPTMSTTEIETIFRNVIDDALRALSTAVVVRADRDDSDTSDADGADREVSEGLQAEPKAKPKRLGGRKPPIKP
jgi:phage terminase Nu1 subunit (DNA packaging protein)